MISQAELHARHAAKIVKAILDADAWKAFLFLGATQIVRGTRRYYSSSKGPDDKRVEILISIGRPNFREREFIKRHAELLDKPQVQLQFRKYRKR